jgi:hypothetical protein
MSDAMRATLRDDRSLLRMFLELPLQLLRPSVEITPEDERAAAEEFDRRRGHNLSLQERSKLAYELAEGSPVLDRRRRVAQQ